MKRLGEFTTGDTDDFGRTVSHYYGCRTCGVEEVVETFAEAGAGATDRIAGTCKKHALNVYSGTRFTKV